MFFTFNDIVRLIAKNKILLLIPIVLYLLVVAGIVVLNGLGGMPFMAEFG